MSTEAARPSFGRILILTSRPVASIGLLDVVKILAPPAWIVTVATVVALLLAFLLFFKLFATVGAINSPRIERMLAGFSARGLTGLAVWLAGRERPALRGEWRSHLAGESGHDPVTWQKVREALGFVASALRCRCSDTADAAWTPVDAVLKSRTLSNLFVLAPTWAAAYLVLNHEGTLGVVKAAEGISAIGGFLYGLVRVGRWWRDVKPPEPKARRVSREEDASP